MVREILMAIQGDKNIVLTWNEGSFKVRATPGVGLHAKPG